MIKFKKFKTTLLKLKEFQAQSDAFLDTVPYDLRDPFFDNGHSNAQGLAHDFLVDQLFGKMAHEAYYFLYEWKLGESNAWVDGVSYDVSTVDKYFEYIKAAYYSKPPVNLEFTPSGGCLPQWDTFQ
jgi:hypothetical protein